MAKRISVRGVKLHRSYRIDQLAEIVEVTTGTVRKWSKAGLPVITDKRPFLILGRDFLNFHAERLRKRRHPLGEFDMFCLRCKKPSEPKPGLVDYELTDANRHQVMALCPRCEGFMRRIVSTGELGKWAVKFGFATNKREDA